MVTNENREFMQYIFDFIVYFHDHAYHIEYRTMWFRNSDGKIENSNRFARTNRSYYRGYYPIGVVRG